MYEIFQRIRILCPLRMSTLYAAHHDTNLPFARAYGEIITALQGAENASYTMYALEHSEKFSFSEFAMPKTHQHIECMPAPIAIWGAENLVRPRTE